MPYTLLSTKRERERGERGERGEREERRIVVIKYKLYVYIQLSLDHTLL